MDREKLKQFIESQLEGTEYFLVDVTVSPANEIKVEIESEGTADLEKCIELNRAIEAEFDREEEDYELEVGTAGLTSPIKVFRQYLKYVGDQLDVLTADGRKLRGELLTADPEKGIVLGVERKVKREGEKRPVLETEEVELPFDIIKKATYHLEF